VFGCWERATGGYGLIRLTDFFGVDSLKVLLERGLLVLVSVQCPQIIQIMEFRGKILQNNDLGLTCLRFSAKIFFIKLAKY